MHRISTRIGGISLDAGLGDGPFGCVLKRYNSGASYGKASWISILPIGIVSFISLEQVQKYKSFNQRLPCSVGPVRAIGLAYTPYINPCL